MTAVASGYWREVWNEDSQMYDYVWVDTGAGKEQGGGIPVTLLVLGALVGTILLTSRKRRG